MAVDVKICGITTKDALQAVAEAGASHVGFNFVARSPRFLDPKHAADLVGSTPDGLTRVGLFADAEDAFLTAILNTVGLDVVQLHGSENPDRVEAVKLLMKKPVWKAVGISSKADIAKAHTFEHVADSLLFDAKPPKSMPLALQGGNGLVFDWNLIAGEAWTVPWILAGGLTAENVADAISTSGASFVDVSSGVETSPGVKDTGKIRDFVRAAQNQSARTTDR